MGLVAYLGAGVIEILRCIHDEIGVAALFGTRQRETNKLRDLRSVRLMTDYGMSALPWRVSQTSLASNVIAALSTFETGAVFLGIAGDPSKCCFV